MKYRKTCLLLLITFMGFSFGCNMLRSVNEERIYNARNKTGDITIGIAWPFKALKSDFVNGIEFAAEKINAAGGINGQKVNLIMSDDESSVTKGLQIAQNFSNNPDIIAVIGHYNSYISLPASSIYENAGILMFTPSSTNPKLTKKGNSYVCRNIPSDLEFGKQLANYAKMRNFKKIMIYYIKNTYGRGLANSFESRAAELDLRIVDRLSYEGGTEREFEQVIDYWNNFEYDSIFLAGTIPEAAVFIKTLREKGINVPVFGGDGLDNQGLINVAGKHAEGVLVASIFDTQNRSEKFQKFRSEYVSKYKKQPDLWAAQGFDALMVIAEAIAQSNSCVPAEISKAIKSFKKWNGVTGLHTFTENGDVINKKFIIKTVKNGQFTFLEKLEPLKSEN